jgi:transcriptional regulator with XRE-family HTH domain
VRRTSQVGRIVDIQLKPKYSRLILARWQGFRRYFQQASLAKLTYDRNLLGQRIRELRDKADLSLRGLAMRIGIPHLSFPDMELGRRFPSEEILAKLADALDVSPDELKQYDTRGPIADLKRLMDSNPKLGFAFRTVVEKVENGELTAEDMAKLSKRKSRA